MTDPVPTIDDPRWVRDQYADSDGLRVTARATVFVATTAA